MKCSKCYSQIKENEEVAGRNTSFYCQTCHKNQKWKETATDVLVYSTYGVATFVLLFCAFYVWKTCKETRKLGKKPGL